MIVEWYTTPSGEQPVREYLDSLDVKMRSKTLRTLMLLQERGHCLREPESKLLRDGIFELRTVMGDNAGRVLYFFCVGDHAVLTHGFRKKTRKTPNREVERAMAYRDDYLRRARKEE